MKIRIKILAIKEEEEAISKPLNFDLNETKQPIKLKVIITFITLKFLIKKSASISAIFTIETNKKYLDMSNYYDNKAE